ncbi:hypothetical protein IJI99_00795 [bacterium]|nr:hypothetical protein [bacterium]
MFIVVLCVVIMTNCDENQLLLEEKSATNLFVIFLVKIGFNFGYFLLFFGVNHKQTRNYQVKMLLDKLDEMLYKFYQQELIRKTAWQ